MTDREQLDLWEERLSAYDLAGAMIGLDADQDPPAQGAAFRDRRRAVLSAERRRVLLDPAMRPVLKRLAAESRDPAARRRAEMRLRALSRMEGVPEEVLRRFDLAKSVCAGEWRAKRFGAWSGITEAFRVLVQAQREILARRGGGYSLLLDDHEEGWDTARYDAFFGEMKARLLPLVRRQPPAPAKPAGPFGPDAQRRVMAEVLRIVRFDPDWGRMGESAHPLTTFLSAGDVRFTTRYRPDDPAAAILSTVHETGHAWYAHNVDAAYDGTILMKGISAAMHESQSRLLENHIGRRRAFWERVLPLLEREFPGRPGDLDGFMAALNAARPGPVRTQADELTYPVHILIRYEMEKALFSGEAEPEDLAPMWNAKYAEYLGVTPANDAEGILQDMHWPYAYFGYFPTYALGSAYAAQFAEAMEREVDVDRALREDRWGDVTAWLRERVQHDGCLHGADDILRRATGRAFDPDCYFRYLEEKFAAD